MDDDMPKPASDLARAGMIVRDQRTFGIEKGGRNSAAHQPSGERPPAPAPITKPAAAGADRGGGDVAPQDIGRSRILPPKRG